jgi:hypothetical protein
MGATWLILKTEGELQKKAVAWTRWGLVWVALGVVLVSLATPLISETVREKWFDFPAHALAHAAAGATFGERPVALVRVGRIAAPEGARAPSQLAPYLAAAAIFTLAFLGLAYSIYPYVVIDRLTMWEAAAHPSAQKVIFLGAVRWCCPSSPATRCCRTGLPRQGEGGGSTIDRHPGPAAIAAMARDPSLLDQVLFSFTFFQSSASGGAGFLSTSGFHPSPARR